MTEQALKRIEEKHFNAGPARPVRHCEPKMPCNEVKLARALADMMRTSGLAEPATRRASWERAERTLEEVAGGGDE